MAGARRARRVVVDVELADARKRADGDADASANVPAQEVFRSGVDHRGITKTVKHGKRKRESDAAATNEGGEDEEMVDGELYRNYKAPKATYDSIAGRKSGRMWKQPAKRASALGAAPSTKTWDDRMREKEEKKRFQEAKSNAKAARGAKIRAERERREAKKLLKEENTRRTGVGIVSEITNPKTIAKKSAKERAKLKKLRML
jgi:rRNA-processing protein CGR1